MLVVAPGSVARTLPIPGLAEHGIGFKTIGEAIFLRNHVLSRLDAADTTIEPALRRRLLTFMFVGGGYAGVEALAELEDMARYASSTTRPSRRDDMRWILVEATGRIMPEVSAKMGRYTVERLLDAQHRRPASTPAWSRWRAGTSCSTTAQEFDTDTIVWTAGRQAHPDAGPAPTCRATSAAASPARRPAGDGRRPGCSARATARRVPDLSKDDPEARTSPSAQHAVRQAKVLGDNVIAHLRGRPLTEYKHAYAGSVASLGLYKGVAEIYGIKLRGFARVVHAPHLPREPDADVQPQDPRRVRLDGRAASSAARWCRSGRSASRKAEFERAATPEPKVTATAP